MVNAEIFVEASCDGGHHALPVHAVPPDIALSAVSFVCATFVARLSMRAGKIGGRTESALHPKRNSVAGPQTRPWHGPMPQRVCNFAVRHDVCACKREYGTSSHRQTNVSAAASCFNSDRNRKVRSSSRAKRFALPRSPNKDRALDNSLAAANPAICPSTSACSTPPMPVGSPAQKTPPTDVRCISSTRTKPSQIWHPTNSGSSVFGTK